MTIDLPTTAALPGEYVYRMTTKDKPACELVYRFVSETGIIMWFAPVSSLPVSVQGHSSKERPE